MAASCGIATVSLDDFNAAFNSAAFCVKAMTVIADETVLSYLSPEDYFKKDSDGNIVESTTVGGTEVVEKQWAPQYLTANDCDCDGCEWVTRDGFENDSQFQTAICNTLDAVQTLGQESHALHVVKLGAMVSSKRLQGLEKNGILFRDYVASRQESEPGFFTIDISLATASALRSSTNDFAAIFPMPFDLKWSPEIFAPSALGGLPTFGANNGISEFSINIAAGSLATDEDATALAAKWQSALESGGVSTANFVGSSRRIIEVRGLNSLNDLKLGGAIVAAQPEALSMEPKRLNFVHNFYSQGFTQSGEVGKPTLWNHGLHGEGEVVGFADSGLDHQSCFFRDAQSPLTIAANNLNNNPGHRKVIQYAAFADNTEGELGGHGTHVGGSIAGHAIDENGLEKHNGMAYASTLAFFDIGEAGQPFLNVPAALESTMFPTAYDVGARIHTNSWGSRGNGYSSNSRSVDVFSFEQQDFLILFAAGNDGAGGAGTVGAPATAKNALSVGASYSPTESFDAEFGAECQSKPCEARIAQFSSLGPASDGRTKPDLVAPGFYIVSAESQVDPTSGHCSVFPNAGTSMATPVVAGLAALVRQYMREGFYPIGMKNTVEYGFNPMGALIKGILINSGNSLTFPVGNGVGAAGPLPSMTQGFGKVTVADSLFFPNSTRVLFADGDFDNMSTLSTGGTKSYPFFVYESLEDFKVTLVWHDAPASTQSTRQLVNDLDLTLATPTGSTLFPNNLNAPDTLNNVEQITVDVNTLTQGLYTVTVKGTSVPVGPQPFALVVTGDFVRSEDMFGSRVVPIVSEMSLFESLHTNGTVDFIQIAAHVTQLPNEDQTIGKQRFNIWCQDPSSNDHFNGLESFPRMQANLDIQENAENGDWIMSTNLWASDLQALTEGQGLETSGEWKWACPEGTQTVGSVINSGLTSRSRKVVFLDSEAPSNGVRSNSGSESKKGDTTVAIASSLIVVGAIGALATSYFISKKGKSSRNSQTYSFSRGSTASKNDNRKGMDAFSSNVLGESSGGVYPSLKQNKNAWMTNKAVSDIL